MPSCRVSLLMTMSDAWPAAAADDGITASTAAAAAAAAAAAGTEWIREECEEVPAALLGLMLML